MLKKLKADPQIVESSTGPIIDPLERLKVLFFIVVTAIIALLQKFTVVSFVIIIVVLSVLYIFFNFFGLT